MSELNDHSPDMARTCCPQYTIRLDSNSYKPTKKHRQVINRFNRYLSTGLKPGEEEAKAVSEGSATMTASDPKDTKKKDKGKGKTKGEWDFITELRAYEEGYHELGVHSYTVSYRLPRFWYTADHYQTELVPAKMTEETYDLYKRYQISVHKDLPEGVTTRGFSRFLCESPLGVCTSHTTQTGIRGLLE